MKELGYCFVQRCSPCVHLYKLVVCCVCSHFADVVVASDPDIIALQEVRLDSSFLSPHGGHTLAHWQDLALHKPDCGNQAEHVLSYLAQARARAASKAGVAAGTGAGGAVGTGVGSGFGGGARTVGEMKEGGLPYYQFVFQPAMSMIDRCASCFVVNC